MSSKGNERMVKVCGKTITGETRRYEFELLTPKVGVSLQNEYRFILMSSATSIAELVSWVIENLSNGLDLGDKEDSLFIRFIKVFKIVAAATPLMEFVPQIITRDRLNDLAAQLLSGGSVDGEVIDDEGMCGLFGRDISEFDAALFHAALANFPYLQRVIDPLLAALQDEGKEKDGTSPASM